MTLKDSGMLCVECGTTKGKFKGSMKHPYCWRCFRKVFGTGKKAWIKYADMLDKTHV
jgi:hypothetical protein